MNIAAAESSSKMALERAEITNIALKIMISAFIDIVSRCYALLASEVQTICSSFGRRVIWVTVHVKVPGNRCHQTLHGQCIQYVQASHGY